MNNPPTPLSDDIRYPVGKECQCGLCGEFFSSETAFEKHWTRDGHQAPGDVGLVQRSHRFGPVWGGPSDPDAPERFNGAAQTAETGPGAVGEPDADLAPSSAAQTLQGLLVGSRGPGGGIVAVCVECGGLWERPVQRGRPAYKCKECR